MSRLATLPRRLWRPTETRESAVQVAKAAVAGTASFVNVVEELLNCSSLQSGVTWTWLAHEPDHGSRNHTSPVSSSGS